MNLFDQYGIKEVADVTIYSIHKKEDGSGEVYYVPALYLDTLKITTTEKSADNTWAQGGLGNSRLVGWDYNKTINLNFEDALCTPASLGLCWGGVLGAEWKDGQVNHQNGIFNLADCGTERISRMEKAFYPRNDTVNATISNLLPRDGTEDILEDQSGDPVYLQRSSVLDGTDIRGFGYVKGHPYKWRAEVESEVMSIAIVPDRFFSIYGKSYPIKRKQTVGINQPSESFKYEIIYQRGYDKYDDEKPQAKIIYHRQAEENITHEYTCHEDEFALGMLDDFTTYPYLKIRVCFDGSIKAYLGRPGVMWDRNSTIEAQEEFFFATETYWAEIPQIDTEQFKGIDMWVRFDSINALSYYIITKYEDNIFSIGPKKIVGGLAESGVYTIKKSSNVVEENVQFRIALRNVGFNYRTYDPTSEEPYGEVTAYTYDEDNPLAYLFIMLGIGSSFDEAEITAATSDIACINFIKTPPTGVDNHRVIVTGAGETQVWVPVESLITGQEVLVDINSINLGKTDSIKVTQWSMQDHLEIIRGDRGTMTVANVVGNDYSLDKTDWEKFENSACTPCCKKANLSRALWAYINPKTMTPYDDDYWFHQGETYYKKSLTLSTKDAPVNAQRIFVQAGVFPGMYKIVGETYIRSRDTGEDERVQLTFPLCKIKSNQTLTLQADGEPVTFNFEVEVANPENGIPMEITFYEVEKDMKRGCGGKPVEKDGSTKVSMR